jgi:hypothetical protein
VRSEYSRSLGSSFLLRCEVCNSLERDVSRFFMRSCSGPGSSLRAVASAELLRGPSGRASRGKFSMCRPVCHFGLSGVGSGLPSHLRPEVGELDPAPSVPPVGGAGCLLPALLRVSVVFVSLRVHWRLRPRKPNPPGTGSVTDCLAAQHAESVRCFTHFKSKFIPR